MSDDIQQNLDEGLKAYYAGNYAVALSSFEKMAVMRDPVGLHLLGSLYYQGLGVPRDLAKAAEFYTQAGEQDYPPSLANLALMYNEGDGVPKDVQKGLDYCVRAAQAGDPQSQFNLGQHFRREEDYEQAALCYRAAAEAGVVGAQNEYGLLCLQGHGVQADYIEAYAWISLSARAGNPSALKNFEQLKSALHPDDLEQAEDLAADYATRYGV